MNLYLPRQKLIMNEKLIFFPVVPLTFNSKAKSSNICSTSEAPKEDKFFFFLVN